MYKRSFAQISPLARDQTFYVVFLATFPKQGKVNVFFTNSKILVL